jgi:hypothetical protein
VEPSFFENMGFPTTFVRRFFCKHDRILRFDGTVARGVRGVSELDFLLGLADVLGVPSCRRKSHPYDIVAVMAVARDCLTALAALDEGQELKNCCVPPRDGVIPPVVSRPSTVAHLS